MINFCSCPAIAILTISCNFSSYLASCHSLSGYKCFKMRIKWCWSNPEVTGSSLDFLVCIHSFLDSNESQASYFLSFILFVFLLGGSRATLHCFHRAILGSMLRDCSWSWVMDYRGQCSAIHWIQVSNIKAFTLVFWRISPIRYHCLYLLRCSVTY